MRKSIKNVESRQARIKVDVFFFNFASSCYHHRCCCSNERSFNFETFLFTSIESLLTLFAVAFIFYCQIIVVRSMFSFHQINLLSRNSLFIHILSVSSSFIIFSTIQYIMFMLASKFLKVLHFDEHNITKFLKRFEKKYNEYEIIEKKINQVFLLLC